MKMKKVVVAMSGGVDSSVAAALIKSQGYQVTGTTLLLSSDAMGFPGQGELSGVESARRVARTLDIPHQVLDLREEFERRVIEPFCREYISGRTPNPCIHCNRVIKFGALLSRARGMGADFVATGHYAQVVYDEQRGRFLLKKGKDTGKDQSYFLFSLGQDQLRSVMLPLGGLNKTEVKALAREWKLAVGDRKESQEICFIPGNDHASFVKQRVSEAGGEGPIVYTTGEVLGRHQGIFSFTVGQRRGLKIARGYPLYVLSVDRNTNTVVVGKKEEGNRKDLTASGLNWIGMESLRQPFETHARIRYKHREKPARVIPWSENRVKVEFCEPQLAITPGQAVVFYEDDLVVGGGWID